MLIVVVQTTVYEPVRGHKELYWLHTKDLSTCSKPGCCCMYSVLLFSLSLVGKVILVVM